MPTIEALRVAREEGLDLVEVAAQARPPVCRIMDFGKYKYEQKLKKRQNAKKQPWLCFANRGLETIYRPQLVIDGATSERSARSDHGTRHDPNA